MGPWACVPFPACQRRLAIFEVSVARAWRWSIRVGGDGGGVGLGLTPRLTPLFSASLAVLAAPPPDAGGSDLLEGGLVGGGVEVDGRDGLRLPAPLEGHVDVVGDPHGVLEVVLALNGEAGDVLTDLMGQFVPPHACNYT